MFGLKKPTPPQDLLAAAEAGDAEAQSDLGRWYDANLPETPLAERWFRRAADQGLPKAFHNMGVLAARAGNNALAIEWFRKAVAADWLNSVFPLGMLLQEAGEIQAALEVYHHGIERGCTDSMEALSRIAIENEIEDLYGSARIWCERAVAKGNLGAHMLLAQIFHEGLGVKADRKEAVSLWMTAARQGHQGAQIMIGMACEMGLGLKHDRVAAMRLYAASAAQGNDAAESCLRSLERKLTSEERKEFARDPTLFAHPGPGHPGKPPPADLLWAAEAGDTESQNELGAWYSNNMPQAPYAQMWFKRAADQGSANAYHNLGVEALRSDDLDLATEWFRKAVDADSIASYANLGELLERSGDMVQAIEIFGQGANRKCPDCQSALGRITFNQKNYDRSRQWDEKAAAQGNAASQTRLGMMYHEGLGVQPDPAEAVRWWQQGARQGNKVAQYMMGIAHHKGNGTIKDRLAAMRFLRASAAQGASYAEEYLPKVEAELTPEELRELASEPTVH